MAKRRKTLQKLFSDDCAGGFERDEGSGSTIKWQMDSGRRSIRK
jgi:hypothetical protein